MITQVDDITLWANTIGVLESAVRGTVWWDLTTGRDKARTSVGEMSDDGAPVSTPNQTIFDPFTDTGAKR